MTIQSSLFRAAQRPGSTKSHSLPDPEVISTFAAIAIPGVVPRLSEHPDRFVGSAKGWVPKTRRSLKFCSN